MPQTPAPQAQPLSFDIFDTTEDNMEEPGASSKDLTTSEDVSTVSTNTLLTGAVRVIGSYGAPGTSASSASPSGAP